MWKSIATMIKEQMKKPMLPSSPKRALHMGNPPEVRKGKNWKPIKQFELFMQIARERAVRWEVIAKHIDFDWKECTKPIKLTALEPINFNHIKPKGMNKDLKLDPDNIEIVSKAYHIFEHSHWIHKLEEYN